MALVVSNLPASAGDIRNTGSIPVPGRSCWEGNGNPHQYSPLKNSMDRGAWRATVHGATKSQTWIERLNNKYEKKKKKNKYGTIYSSQWMWFIILNRMKDKNHSIISTDTEKAFHNKKSQQTGFERNISPHNKGHIWQIHS